MAVLRQLFYGYEWIPYLPATAWAVVRLSPVNMTILMFSLCNWRMMTSIPMLHDGQMSMM